MTVAVHQLEAENAPLVIDDRYTCVDVIGHGRHATVWRAVDNRLGRHVAVKIFRTSTGVHAAGARAGVEAMARLPHPNIVRMFDSGRSAESPSRRSYLVLELVEGASLATTRERMSTDEVLRMGLALAGALAHLHRHEAVHAGIRPSNVIVPSSGSGFVPEAAKLCDLRVFDDLDLEYAAPELHDGDVATAAGDIYALGVVLGEASAARERADVHVVDLFGPDVPLQWEGLQTRMCDVDPAARPSATAVAVELMALVTAQAGAFDGRDAAPRERGRRSVRPRFGRRAIDAVSPTIVRRPRFGGVPVTHQGDVA